MSRRHEPRIVDPHTHPRRYVSLRVAATYLEVDARTLAKFLDAGTLPCRHVGSRRQIPVAALPAFEASLFHVKQQSAHTTA
jgi:hypothetical protein